MAPFEEAGAAEVAGPVTLLTFELAGQRLALEVTQIREVLDLQPVARVPNAPSDMVGVIDVRGEGVALVDLACRLGMHREGGAREARIIVLELAGADGVRVVGFEADRVVDVVDVEPAAIEPVPAAGGALPAATGMARLDGKLTMVVDLAAVLRDEAVFR